MQQLLKCRRYWIGALAGLLLVSVVASLASSAPKRSELTTPSARDRQITLAVVSLLGREHLSTHELDDEISQRAFDSFLKALDPMKVYFYQSDIDAFRHYEDRLDDMARRGDISFAYLVFKTFLERIDERVAVIDELLETEHDFTVDEKMVIDRDEVRYAASPEEARERWRKRIKYDLLVLMADGTDGEDAIDRLRRRYHSFANRMHQTDGDELLEMYLSSITTAYDPHTSYMSPSTLENFEIMMRLNLEGVGASLQSVDGYTVVKKIIPGGAADRQGELKVEDRVVGVGQGEDGEIVDVVDMKLSDVVDMIRGKRGTIVRLEVTPADSTTRKIIRIERDRIELTDSEAKGKVFEAGRRPDSGQPYKIGVIDLPSFYMDMAGARLGLPDFKSTTRDVRNILDDFREQGVDAVVLDLRRNGGGSLTEAISLTGLFLPEGPVVQVKDSGGRVQPYHNLDPSMAWKGPLVVVVSKFSASASEILAGAIQDYGRGLVVGDYATHGKGTVQSLMDLGQQLFRIPNAPSMGALKVTMQQFYRPSGDSTQKRGVESDVEIPSLITHLDVAEGDLDFPVAFDRVEPLTFRRFGYVDPAVRELLRRRSEERCAESEDFDKVRENVAHYKEQKARKYVTLNKEEFLAERAELNAEREQQKHLEELNDAASSTEIKRDFYLDEVLAIAVDFLNARQLAQAR
ncbi:MAG: carboxy terminal-processing peptidase [Thermoguttaceae bacterium]|jgi:carboxyl-terminal processing protease|nr:carboxy terminal-processing peptidase [Thermoguttaceae bacterium]